MKPLSAVQTMRKELAKIQTEQMTYVTDEGFVKPFYRERYLFLGQEAKKYFDAIKTFEELMNRT